MPYIPETRREEIHQELLDNETGGLNWYPENAGDLNFTITCFIDNYLASGEGLRYAKLNEMIGALECCKLELYRLIGSPYEDVKLAENGGVYTVETFGKAY